LYPVGAEVMHQEEQKSQEPPDLPTAQAPPLAYGEVPFDEMVSHVEALPNCNEPVFETVPAVSSNIVHI
jgi:hypothetical protein